MARPEALPAGFRRLNFDSLLSTNSEALALARGGESGNLWVTAREQSGGRGRRGREWITGRGNLAASLLLIDAAPASMIATISFVAAVAVHQAVMDIAGPALADRLSLKWPNDLVLDKHKIAGILVEGETLPSGSFAVVVGIGVNCVSHPETTAPTPASDLSERGIHADAEALFARLVVRMGDELDRWQRGDDFPATRAAWLTRSWGVGGGIRINLGDRVVEGRFENLDECGRLVLAKADGAREIFTAGDVFFPGAR
jgi:BirA family biotin operon repressor/biotin-[acetyl-CoA-carboxylase] ligase